MTRPSALYPNGKVRDRFAPIEEESIGERARRDPEYCETLRAGLERRGIPEPDWLKDLPKVVS